MFGWVTPVVLSLCRPQGFAHQKFSSAVALGKSIRWTQECQRLEAKCEEERGLGQEFAEEAQEWVKLTGRLSDRVNALTAEVDQVPKLRKVGQELDVRAKSYVGHRSLPTDNLKSRCALHYHPNSEVVALAACEEVITWCILFPELHSDAFTWMKSARRGAIGTAFKTPTWQCLSVRLP